MEKISSNILKIIAIILMVIDHIGLYLYNQFECDTYYFLRSIGRIAMPIFAYLIVQGFFYTKNLKNYIFRIFMLGTCTQLILFILGYINQEYFPIYSIGINEFLDILYSYTFSLILLAVIDRKKIIKKWDENKNLILRINIFILIVLAYLKLKLEFGMRIPFIFLELYAIEKLLSKDNILILKQNFKTKFDKIKNKIIYISLILFAFGFSLCFMRYSSGCKYAVLLSAIPIAFYSGERGNKNKFIQFIFYAIFPLQHIALYLLGMLLR